MASSSDKPTHSAMSEKPDKPATATATTTVTVSTDDDKASKKKTTLVVRLLADYWDKDGVRHSAAYVDDNGEKHATGALLELPAEEARQLVKTHAAERGDEY